MQAYIFEKILLGKVFCFLIVFLSGVHPVWGQCSTGTNGYGSIWGPQFICPGEPCFINFYPYAPNPVSVQWTVFGGTIISGQGTNNLVVSFPNAMSCSSIPVPTRVEGELDCNGQFSGWVEHEVCVIGIPQTFLELRGPDTVFQGQVADYDYCEDPGWTAAVGFSGSPLSFGDCAFVHNSYQLQQDTSNNCFWHGGFSVSWDSPGAKLMKVVMTVGNGGAFCADTIYKTVTVLPTTAPTSLGNDTTLQAGDSLVLPVPVPYHNPVWQDGSTADSFLVTCPGTYFVSGTYCGSPISDTVIVSGPSFQSLSLLSDSASCVSNLGLQNSPLLLHTSQVNPPNLLWSTGSTNDSIFITAPGTYWAQSIDTFGCLTSDTLQIGLSSGYANLPTDTGDCTLPLVLASGGSQSASLTWSTGATTDTIWINAPGTYWVTALDSSGCKSSDTVQVHHYTLVPVNLPSDTTLCWMPYLLQADPPGLHSLLWPNNSSADSIWVNSPGTYSVIAADTNGCKSTDTIHINQYPSLHVSLPSDTMACSFPFTLTAGPSSMPSLLWSTGAFSPSIPINGPGTYWVMGVDSFGCTSRDSILVTTSPPPTISANVSPSTNQNGSIMIIAFGGVWPLQYSLDGVNFQGAASFYNLPPGLYTYYVQDNWGCIHQDTVTVPLVTGMPDLSSPQLSVYPNPSTGKVRLLIGQSGEFTASVHSVAGKMLLRAERLEGGKEQILDLSHLPNGIYFLSVEFGEQRLRRVVSLSR